MSRFKTSSRARDLVLLAELKDHEARGDDCNQKPSQSTVRKRLFSQTHDGEYGRQKLSAKRSLFNEKNDGNDEKQNQQTFKTSSFSRGLDGSKSSKLQRFDRENTYHSGFHPSGQVSLTEDSLKLLPAGRVDVLSLYFKSIGSPYEQTNGPEVVHPTLSSGRGASAQENYSGTFISSTCFDRKTAHPPKTAQTEIHPSASKTDFIPCTTVNESSASACLTKMPQCTSTPNDLKISPVDDQHQESSLHPLENITCMDSLDIERIPIVFANGDELIPGSKSDKEDECAITAPLDTQNDDNEVDLNDMDFHASGHNFLSEDVGRERNIGTDAAESSSEAHGANVLNEYLSDLGLEPFPPGSPPPSSTAQNERLYRQHKEPRTPSVARKKSLNPATWKANVLKEKLNSGKEYINSNGKAIPARSVKPGCGQNCRFKCEQKMTEEERQTIHSHFWAIGNHTRQWDFIAHHTVNKSAAESKVEESRRLFSNKYFFNISGRVVYVCRTMFLSTLDVSASYIKTALSKLVKNNSTISPDKRGKNEKSHIKIPDNVLKYVRTHIKKFPLVPSHYCRKDSKKSYLPQGLSVSEMYRQYIKYMEKKHPEKKKVSENTYRHVFNFEFNIAFHRPKKDQCHLCHSYDNASASQKAKLKVRHDLHIGNKELSREMGKEYKALATKPDSKICYACFDLQKVLILPKAETGSLYYYRNWNCYNFTVYDVGKHDGHCYFWDETEGKRGSDEIASSLLLFMETAKQTYGYDHFIFISDNCSGQNKNRMVFAMYYFASLKFSVKITHLFLETGHTQNEGDNMHALIEKECHGKEVYTPEQWINIIKNSKKTGKPYSVVKIKDFIKNFKPLKQCFSWDKDSEKKKVSYHKAVEVLVDANLSPGKLFIRYDLRKTEKVEVPIVRAARGRPINFQNFALQRAYNGPILLPPQKLKDFAKMCFKLTIPLSYQERYKSLPGFPQLSAADIDDPDAEDLLEEEPIPEGEAEDLDVASVSSSSTDYEGWLQRNPDEED